MSATNSIISFPGSKKLVKAYNTGAVVQNTGNTQMTGSVSYDAQIEYLKRVNANLTKIKSRAEQALAAAIGDREAGKYHEISSKKGRKAVQVYLQEKTGYHMKKNLAAKFLSCVNQMLQVTQEASAYLRQNFEYRSGYLNEVAITNWRNQWEAKAKQLQQIWESSKLEVDISIEARGNLKASFRGELEGQLKASNETGLSEGEILQIFEEVYEAEYQMYSNVYREGAKMVAQCREDLNQCFKFKLQINLNSEKDRKTTQESGVSVKGESNASKVKIGNSTVGAGDLASLAGVEGFISQLSSFATDGSEFSMPLSANWF